MLALPLIIAMTVCPIDTIVSDPRVRGGQPILAAATLRVPDLVTSPVHCGVTPEELENWQKQAR